MSATEMDVRNSTTPPLDYNDISTAEIELKIRLVETFIQQTFFDGGSIPSGGDDAVIMLVLSNLLSTGERARKYGTLISERFADYSYTLAEPGGGKTKSSPLEIVKSWHDMALDILMAISADKKYVVRVVND